MKLHRPLGAVAGAGLVAVGVISAVRIAGSRLRGRQDPLLDALGSAPHDPVHRQIVTADGGQLHVVDVGAGRPVVLLHGVTLQWWVWSALITLLRHRNRVVAWDMRGHGSSRAGTDGVSLEATADDLATVLRELDLENAILVGHSMGGMTLGHFVRRHPETLAARVGALCFCATSASTIKQTFSKGTLKTWYGFAGRSLLESLKRPVPRYPWPDNDLSAVLLRAAFGPAATGEMLEMVRKMSADMTTASMIEAGNALAAHDVRDALGGIAVPTAVVVGDCDRITPPGHAEELAALIPGSTLVVLADVGHQVMQEDPEALVEIIAELERLSAPGSTARVGVVDESL